MFLEDFLGLIGTVEGLASLRDRSRAGVIAADNEMTAAVILADERVPDGLARSAHAHGERQQGKFGGRLRKLGEQQLIATHSRVVIHIAGLGHAHDGMNQQAGLDLLGGAECELDVSAVHGIASLEGDHTPPADAGKLGPHLGRSQAQVTKIVVRRESGSPLKFLRHTRDSPC